MSTGLPLLSHAERDVVEERCLRVLSAPSLDNKLPQHIRERIVHYKEALEVTLSNKGFRVPEWLPALQ